MPKKTVIFIRFLAQGCSGDKKTITFTAFDVNDAFDDVGRHSLGARGSVLACEHSACVSKCKGVAVIDSIRIAQSNRNSPEPTTA